MLPDNTEEGKEKKKKMATFKWRRIEQNLS
ncbi:hypothetical protein QG37_01287 [Candidozyma auris]|nr:hypothetical protein QG37_01287 [[Candida] auris]